MLSGTEVTNPTSGFERLRGKQVSGFIDASKQIYFLLMIHGNCYSVPLFAQKF